MRSFKLITGKENVTFGLVTRKENNFTLFRCAKQRVAVREYLGDKEYPTDLKKDAIVEKCLMAQRYLTAKEDKGLTEISLKSELRYGLLYKNATGDWRIADKTATDSVPEGLYTYVRTKQGFIHIVPVMRGETKHLILADYAENVRYAGCISFKKDGSGEIEHWDNDSGGYKPSPSLYYRAGLPLNLFKDKSMSQRAKVAINKAEPVVDEVVNQVILVPCA
jgi:hypothetical protein